MAPPRAPPRLAHLHGSDTAPVVTLWIHGYQTDGDLVRLSYFEKIPEGLQCQPPDGGMPNRRQLLFRYGAHLTVAEVGEALAGHIVGLGAGVRLQIRAHSMGGLVFAAAINHLGAIAGSIDNAIFYDCPFAGVNLDLIRNHVIELKEQRRGSVQPNQRQELDLRLAGHMVLYKYAESTVASVPLLGVLRSTNGADPLEALREPIANLAGAHVPVVMCPVRGGQIFPSWTPTATSAREEPMDISVPENGARSFGPVVTALHDDIFGHRAMFKPETLPFHRKLEATFELKRSLGVLVLATVLVEVLALP